MIPNGRERAAGLTPRQKDCLRLVYRRRTSKEIAAELGLSPGTVDTYCAEAVAALGASNRRHAAEILQFAEDGEVRHAPREMTLEFSGVMLGTPNGPSSGYGNGPLDWRQLLPFRPTGAADNDLPLLLRLAWIPVIAALTCIGFGMLGVALSVIADLFRGGR